jgi:Ser/Thr protein kinase RdoA (MazF antagonist)
MKLEEQIESKYSLKDPKCRHLNTPVNDVIAVATTEGQFALKLYNTQSRTIKQVQWELDLIVHLVKHSAPVVRAVRGKHGYVESIRM